MILPGGAAAQAPGNSPQAAVQAPPETKPAVAAYIAGDAIPDYQKVFLETYLLNAIINSGADVSNDNADAFATVVGEEQAKRWTTMLDDSILCEIGRKTGVRYICAVSATPARNGVFTLSGRIISVKTGQSRFNGEAAGALNTMGDLARVADMVLEKMFGGGVFGGQLAPNPAVSTPPVSTPSVSTPLVSTPPISTPPDSTPLVLTPPVLTPPVPASLNELPPPVDAAAIFQSAAAAPFDTAEIVTAEPADTAYSPYSYAALAAPKPYSARVRNVAVVETEIDAQSGASAELTTADARLVTAELRREAVKHLPHGRYNVMTSETVYSQGSAVLEACIDENCVIKIGNAIGADFIVRGIISKMQTKFNLTVEIYETEDGNLVASSDPIRSESLGELLEQAAAVCAEMYKSFVITHTPPPEPVTPPPTATPPVIIQEPDTPLWKLHKMGIDISVGGGGLIAGGSGGGIEWSSGERVTMPYSAVGAYLFLDVVYAEFFIGYRAGDGTWESPNAPDGQELPNMPRSGINVGAFAKYPFNRYKRVKLFPLIGLDYEASISGKIKHANGKEYVFDGANNHPEANSLSSLWFKFGGGIDFAMGKTIYLRSELIYGLRAANAFEWYCVDRLPYNDVNVTFGQGVDFKIGIGIKL